MIRRCTESDLDGMYMIINDPSQAYKGVIPDDRWHEPLCEQPGRSMASARGFVATLKS